MICCCCFPFLITHTPTHPGTVISMDLVTVPERVAIHPVVILAIQDHFRRTHVNTTRVVGALLGSWSGKQVNVTNAFAIPFNEDPADRMVWFVDQDYLQAMRDLHKKVNCKERLVGWYHTGSGVSPSDAVIMDMIAGSLDTACPVMMVCGSMVGCSGGSVSGQANGQGQANYANPQSYYLDPIAGFVHTKTIIAAEEAEEVGVEHLLRDVADTAAGSLSRGLAAELRALQQRRDGVEEIIAYLERNISGSLPVNQEILGSLQALALGRNHETSDNVNNQSTHSRDDQVMIYVGQLARAVLSVHDLIDNKETMKKEQVA